MSKYNSMRTCHLCMCVCHMDDKTALGVITYFKRRAKKNPTLICMMIIMINKNELSQNNLRLNAVNVQRTLSRLRAYVPQVLFCAALVSLAICHRQQIFLIQVKYLMI